MHQFARLLGATVGLLMLIGCATVGTLLLVRTEARREEFAMCLALGATRSRLSRGIAAEGALLAAAGAALALPVTLWLFGIVRAFQLPGGVNLELLDLRVDTRVLAAAAAAAVLATLLLTLIAGVFGFAADAGDALRSRTGATPRVARRRTRAVLVAAQVAVALVLVAGAGLFVRSLRAALSLNPGIETSRIINVSLSLGHYEYTPPRATAFFDDLRGRLTGNPAIGTVSFTANQGGFAGAGFIVDGMPRLVSGVSFIAVDQMYFETLGTGMLQGRGLSAQDVAGAPMVAIVSESFGRFLGEGGTAIGRRLTMPYRRPPAPAPVVDVVGVVPDVITSVATLEPMVLYLPIEQATPGLNRIVVLRATSDADAAKREALSAIKEIDRSVTPGPMLTIDERLTRQMAPQHFGAVVLAALGAIAVLLTILGTYVLSESMAMLRMREMGVRAALGATRQQLALIVLGETGRLVGFGLVLGLGFAWLGASTIRALLFRVEPLDPVTLGGVAAVILFLAMGVSLRPALRAARVDLGAVLRDQ
jgi:putative ABC transport system permease protein